ncbi:hypothetical protein [Sphingopyxis panaciterrae]
MAATLIAISTVLGVSLSDASLASDPNEWHVATGALDDDCHHSGVNPDGGTQFILTCPQSSISPDGRWRLVQTPAVGPEEVYDVGIEQAGGGPMVEVSGVNDGMPFILYWSPRPGFFMINHWGGSGLQRPRVFRATAAGVVELKKHLRAGAAKAREISPCLPDDERLWLTGDFQKWSKDGRRIAWVFNTRPDMCVFYDPSFSTGPIPPEKRWKPFLMISDVETGAIVSNSVRMLADGGDRELPTDGPYADF